MPVKVCLGLRKTTTVISLSFLHSNGPSPRNSQTLIGQTFSVYTDNNPLTYTLTSAKRGANGHTEADALSRLPHTLIICMDTVKANCDSDQGHPLIESLP